MKKMMVFLFTVFFLTTCSTTSVSTLKSDGKVYQGYSIKNVSSRNIDPVAIGTFEKQLDQELKSLGYRLGKDIEIQYDIRSFDEGNRALRYLVGFGAGAAKSHIETTLVDLQGKALGTVSTEAVLAMGAFGGDGMTPIENAAKDIAQKIAESGILSK